MMHVLSSTCGAGGKSDMSGKMLSLMTCPKQQGMSKYPAEHSPASDFGWLGVSTGESTAFSFSKQGVKPGSVSPLCPVEEIVCESAMVSPPQQAEKLCKLSSLN